MNEKQKWPTVHDCVLHVYGQYAWHDVVEIVGTSVALRLLAKVVNRAVSQQSAETDEVFVNDGEGFTIRVVRLDDSPTVVRLAVPYTAEYAQEKNADAISPSVLARTQ